MKKLKITGFTILAVLILVSAYGFYRYKTNYYINALVNNTESKLFYRPSSEIENINDLDYVENQLMVEDSIQIYTYIFNPIQDVKANIFLIRGNSGNTSKNIDLIKPLVANGFKVYTTDWRGYGKSTGVPTYKGILKDTESAFQDFLMQTKNDSIKTVVYGMSLGGQVAVKIAKDNQTKVDALVLDGSLESAHSFITDNFREFYLQRFIHPENYNQEYVAVNDIAEIKNIPKLIIHSNKDRAVPFERGENIFNAAKEPKVFWETNTGHIKTLTDLPKEVIVKLETLIK